MTHALGGCATDRDDGRYSPFQCGSRRGLVRNSRASSEMKRSAGCESHSGDVSLDRGRREIHGRHVVHSNRLAILFKFSVRQTKLHSAVTFSSPLIENERKPMTDLIQPNGGSTMHLRLL